MVYNKKRFKEIKEKNPTMAFTEVSRVIVDEYKKLTDKERTMYQKEVDEQNVIRLEEFEKNGGVLGGGGKGRETTANRNSRAPAKVKVEAADKKPMTPFMFYMQVRRAELRDP